MVTYIHLMILVLTVNDTNQGEEGDGGRVQEGAKALVKAVAESEQSKVRLPHGVQTGEVCVEPRAQRHRRQ